MKNQLEIDKSRHSRNDDGIVFLYNILLFHTHPHAIQIQRCSYVMADPQLDTKRFRKVKEFVVCMENGSHIIGTLHRSKGKIAHKSVHVVRSEAKEQKVRNKVYSTRWIQQHDVGLESAG